MKLPDHQQGRAARFSSPYPLTVDRAYIVVGMLVAESVLSFLIQDDWGKPADAPVGMFDLVSGTLPPDWGFSLQPGIRLSGDEIGRDPIVAAWGYPEMIDNPNHLYSLFEGDYGALAIFAARVHEAEQALKATDD